MATKTNRKPLSAKEHDAKFRAGMKGMDQREKKAAPVLRELRKIADE